MFSYFSKQHKSFLDVNQIESYDHDSRQNNQSIRNTMWQNLRAALRGEKEAQYTMGISYLNGQLGLDRSYSHAEKWLHQAAQQGHQEATQKLLEAYNKLAF